jgi:hypothetical protein
MQQWQPRDSTMEEVMAEDSKADTKTIFERILDILGLSMDSKILQAELESLFQSPPQQSEIKCYSDVVYENYFDVGISFQYAPATGYRPQQALNLDRSKLSLQSIDIYNNSATSRGERPSYSPFPLLPIRITTVTGYLEIGATTRGKDFVDALGEPPRKGGGDGPSSGLNIWCEWPQHGLMVEFGATGPQAWEKGKDAAWKCITIFSPNY